MPYLSILKQKKMSTSNPIVDSTYPPLVHAQTKDAVRDKVATYPEVIRAHRDFPVSEQGYALVSFNLFKEPRVVAGNPCYGFFKVRGNWGTVEMAQVKAAGIMREQDSVNLIRILPVGGWVPITEAVMDEKIVDVHEDDIDQARAEQYEERTKKDTIKMKQLEERVEEFKQTKDFNDNPTGLDYYTMKRVAWMQVGEHLAQFKRKVKEMETKKDECRDILRKLDITHPEHFENWLANYNKECNSVGIPSYIPSASEKAEYETTR